MGALGGSCMGAAAEATDPHGRCNIVRVPTRRRRRSSPLPLRIHFGRANETPGHLMLPAPNVGPTLLLVIYPLLLCFSFTLKFLFRFCLFILVFFIIFVLISPNFFPHYHSFSLLTSALLSPYFFSLLLFLRRI